MGDTDAISGELATRPRARVRVSTLQGGAVMCAIEWIVKRAIGVFLVLAVAWWLFGV